MNISELSFLVVEDHAFQRETLVELLRNLHAKQVHSAADGQQAFDFLKTQRITAIFTSLTAGGGPLEASKPNLWCFPGQ